MAIKADLKKKAVSLRKQGKTYSEILAKVPVAKSTLSLWLCDVGLAKPQQQRISQKRQDAQKRGAEARRSNRIEKTEHIFEEAAKDVGRLSQRDLWLIGVMLYWAEGSKEKAWSAGKVRLEFMNSDKYMVAIYMRWLREILKISESDIIVGVYIHQDHQHREKEVLKHWIQWAGISRKQISHIYYKKHNPKTKRKNIGSGYYGALRITVKKSTDINRKVAGWTKAIYDQLIN